MDGNDTDRKHEFLVSFDNDRKILWKNIMDGYNTDKKYDSIKIPDRQKYLADGVADGLPLSEQKFETADPDSQDNDADSLHPSKAGNPSSSDNDADSSHTLKVSAPVSSDIIADSLHPSKAGNPSSSDNNADSSHTLKASDSVSPNEGYFYEIEYDSNPVPGVGRYVLKPQQIQAPAKDEIRDLFAQMKDISKAHHSSIDYSRFFDRRVYNDNAFIFYKQGMFMKDFTDDYKDSIPFSSYFPYYQMMGYEQLRTYFTWRTQVRNGNIADVSLSYAFLYIYELLGNIGFDNPQDALDKLMHFWQEFRAFNSAIDRYIFRWLKDYHIYYELPQSFKEFIDQNDLAMHYPKLVDNKNSFDLFCSISKYDVRKSIFFAEGREKLITDCFYFVIDKLRQILLDSGIRFEEAIFQPTRKISAWKPFRDALFYQCVKQPDKHVVISENEIYICKQNTWTFSKELTSGNGRELIGYIIKKIESVLRQATKYKVKLTANISAVNQEMILRLGEQGMSFDKIISNAVFEFYKEVNKTVVIVDHENLSKIRQDALSIQQKLSVPEHDDNSASFVTPFNPASSELQQTKTKPLPDNEHVVSNVQKTKSSQTPTISQLAFSDLPNTAVTRSSGNKSGLSDLSKTEPDQSSNNEQAFLDFADFNKAKSSPSFDNSPTPLPDVWESFKNALTPTEKQALSIALSENTQLKKFADKCGIMLEVMIDGINEKAMDFINDNLMDEEFVIYDDYIDKIEYLVK